MMHLNARPTSLLSASFLFVAISTYTLNNMRVWYRKILLFIAKKANNVTCNWYVAHA